MTTIKTKRKDKRDKKLRNSRPTKQERLNQGEKVFCHRKLEMK